MVYQISIIMHSPIGGQATSVLQQVATNPRQLHRHTSAAGGSVGKATVILILSNEPVLPVDPMAVKVPKSPSTALPSRPGQKLAFGIFFAFVGFCSCDLPRSSGLHCGVSDWNMLQSRLIIE
jgi:hypothetical protein